MLESRRTPSSIYVYVCGEFWESSTFRAVFETEKNAFQTNSSEMAAQHPFPSFSQLATQERKTIRRNGRSVGSECHHQKPAPYSFPSFYDTFVLQCPILGHESEDNFAPTTHKYVYVSHV